MIRSRILILMFFCLGTNILFAQTNEITKPDLYTLNTGDLINITVIPEGEQGLTINRIVKIRPDGYFSFEYVGMIKAENKTIMEVTNIVHKELLKYFNSIDVTINLEEQLRKQKIYVFGEVNNPGMFTFEGEKKVLDAITLAGSYTRFANLNKVKLVREVNDGSVIESVRIKDVIDKGIFENDQFLQDGDIITVPPRNWAKLGNFFTNVLYPFREVIAVVVSVSAAYLIYNR